MRAYRVAAEALEAGWPDAAALQRHPLTGRIAEQLYAAIASISANLGEGYSRSSGPDRVRLFEYALGSVREATALYNSARPVLGQEVVLARLAALDEIRRLLLAIIPRERKRTIRPGSQSQSQSQSES